MKKFSQFAILFVLLVSFTAPLSVFAACPTACSPNLSGVCVSDYDGVSICGTSQPSSTSVGGGTGAGSINRTYLDFYYYLVLTTVNSYLVPILIAVAFIVFLFGIYRYFIQGAANESEKAEGRKFAMWGIIGLVIISSIWGLVNLVKGTIIPSSASQNHPTYPTL